MQPNSYSYVAFVLLAAALFWTLPVRARQSFVIVASIVFYALWVPSHIVIPIAVAAFVWWCARRMIRGANKRIWLRVGVVSVLSLLIIFKYSGFVADNLRGAVSALGSSGLTWPAIALPAGISFISFAVIGLLIDTKQGRIKPTSFRDVLTFVFFWPTVTAGPILRFRELASQMKFQRTFEISMLIKGLDRIVWGLVQKNVIANSLDSWIREGFLPQAAAVNSSLDNWALAVAYGLQIYFDFASYSNMAVGTAHLIGVTLPENFRFPYHAGNPSEFWSRWHMSLSRWIRDYLFFPINARFRGAAAPLYLSLIGVMALVGLWHGAGWGFILWGAMHGAYMVLHRMWQSFREGKLAGRPEGVFEQAGWRVVTLLGVVAAWVPFRAATVGQSVDMLQSMTIALSFRPSYSVNFYLIVLMIAAFAAVEPFLCEWLKQVESKVATRVGEVRYTALVRPLLYAAGLFLFIIFDDRGSQFIYFQF
jgi:alginate O-acetyltransferase complex protein AlgI